MKQRVVLDVLLPKRVMCLTLGRGGHSTCCSQRRSLEAVASEKGTGRQTPPSRCLWLFVVLPPFRCYRGTRSTSGAAKGPVSNRERWVQAPVSGWALDDSRSSPWTLLPCWGLVGLVVVMQPLFKPRQVEQDAQDHVRLGF